MRRALNLSSNVARQNTCAFDHFSCAFAPDGRTNIVGGESGRVHFLQLVEVDTKTAFKRQYKDRALTSLEIHTEAYMNLKLSSMLTSAVTHASEFYFI